MADIEDLIIEISPYYKEKKAKKQDIAEEEHNLGYESTSESLEPIYFWIVDFMQITAGQIEKISDNFTSSPGSGHFSELMGKATQMQNQAMSIMQTLGILVKSIIQIIYDLREYQLVLANYKNLKSKDANEREAAKLALKQRWLDQVDIKRGNTSIKGLASQFQYVTLIDAFMTASSLSDVKKLDLNERVKKILEARLAEYLEWENRSGKELAKRYQIEKRYLKSQVDSLKLYTRWVKPYLRAARQLEQKETSSPELVTAFNTILLELILLARKELDFTQAVVDKELPQSFKKKNLKRKYYSCVLVDFKFRGIPQRITQTGHYGFGGRTRVKFKAYALNEQELAALKQKLDESDINDGLRLAQGMTDESLGELKQDIDEFLEETEKEKEKTEDIDPFTALFKSTKSEEEKKLEKPGKIKPDNYVEKTIRNLAVKNSKRTCFQIFDVYKKTHGMMSHPNPYDEIFIPTED